MLLLILAGGVRLQPHPWAVVRISLCIFPSCFSPWQQKDEKNDKQDLTLQRISKLTKDLKTEVSHILMTAPKCIWLFLSVYDCS